MLFSDAVEGFLDGLIDGGQTNIAPFDEGERVLYGETGEWGTVVQPGAKRSGVLLDGRSYESSLPNGTLIPEDNIDLDPYNEEEGWKK